MNRSDFQRLARIRLREARLLLENECYGGATLKACIARKTRRYEFPPDRKTVEGYYVHNLQQLASAVGEELKAELARPELEVNWAIVTQWTEARRYAFTDRKQAEDMIRAITDRRNGILQCIRRHW